MTGHHYKCGDAVTLDVNHWCKGWQARAGTVYAVNKDGDVILIRLDDREVWSTADKRVRNVKPSPVRSPETE